MFRKGIFYKSRKYKKFHFDSFNLDSFFNNLLYSSIPFILNRLIERHRSRRVFQLITAIDYFTVIKIVGISKRTWEKVIVDLL